MTNASFFLLAAVPPLGSAVRLKSRLRRYSVSCDSALAVFAGAACFFEAFGLAAAAFLGILQDLVLRFRATFFACRDSAPCEAADRPSRLSRCVIALLRLDEGRLGFRRPCPTA